MNNLDLKKIALNGFNLIEASAGTGKTFTISHLYLRLVLKAQQGLLDAPLNVEQILVVTFTNAATEELKDRIRAILVEALTLLRSGGYETGDDLLAEIINEALTEHSAPELIARLRQSIYKMEDAAVFTIHGFCQRVLSEFSFFSGQQIEQTLTTNASDMLSLIAEKYWRENFYKVDEKLAALIQKQWKTPDDLRKYYQPFLAEQASESESIDTVLAQFNSSFKALQEAWLSDKKWVYDKFEEGGFGQSYTKKTIPKRLDALKHFVENPSFALLQIFDNDLNTLRQSVLDEKLAKAKNSIASESFALLDTLFALAQSISENLLLETHSGYKQAVEQYKQDNAYLFFDDLIARLHAILKSESPLAMQLTEALRQQYPVALIDEFQDTDDMQYGIFSRIYQNGEGNALFMIGDPKQAIYSFRGADIHSYFTARNQVSEKKRYTLDTNWRSLPTLVANINQLFSIHDEAFVQQDFPAFVQVQSPEAFNNMQALEFAAEDVGEGESSVNSVKACMSLLALSESEGSIDAIRQEAAEKTAALIKPLLETEQYVNGKLIEPRDIAVLVRTGSQAKLLQTVFSSFGVNSIFLAKDSVLNSIECAAFVQLIASVLEPFKEASIYTALANDLIGKTQAELLAIKAESECYFSHQAVFIEALTLWQKKGFLTMWQYLLSHYGIAERLLSQTQGERRLTNLNQVAEIFQQQTVHFDKVLQQFEHFKQVVKAAVEDDDYQRIRLDSEANLVQIITMHKSKGLEYPIVFCPFLFEKAQAVKAKPQRVNNRQDNTKTVIWQISDEQKNELQKAQFAEDIRLLYVALTRAKYHLSFCFGKVKDVDKSALWHLLFSQAVKSKNLTEAEILDAFSRFDACVINPKLKASALRSTEKQTDIIGARTFTRRLPTSFIARSYSALLDKTTQASSANSAEDSLQTLANDEKTEFDVKRDEPEIPPFLLEQTISEDEFEETIFHFPKGSDAGNFMHLVLENIAFSATKAEIKKEVECQLQRFNFALEPWTEVVSEHFYRLLNKPLLNESLSSTNCCLADLSEQAVLKEMGFHLKAKKTDGLAIAKLLSRYRGGAAVSSFNIIDGLFKGFIDLLFEHHGQYFVVDYKSNFLGNSCDDYSHTAMHESIEEHQYDLQYLIYLAALQRFLKTRLNNYSYDKHIGGVYYLFLRGMNNDNNAGIYYAKPDAKTIDAFEALFFQASMKVNDNA
jgi:exodeoxyribonuclease V beta subunit